MREKAQATKRAKALARVVLPTPGRFPISRWSLATRQPTICSTTCGLPSRGALDGGAYAGEGLFGVGDGGAGNKIVACGTRRIRQAGSNEGGGVTAEGIFVIFAPGERALPFLSSVR